MSFRSDLVHTSSPAPNFRRPVGQAQAAAAAAAGRPATAAWGKRIAPAGSQPTVTTSPRSPPTQTAPVVYGNQVNDSGIPTVGPISGGSGGQGASSAGTAASYVNAQGRTVYVDTNTGGSWQTPDGRWHNAYTNTGGFARGGGPSQNAAVRAGAHGHRGSIINSSDYSNFGAAGTVGGQLGGNVAPDGTVAPTMSAPPATGIAGWFGSLTTGEKIGLLGLAIALLTLLEKKGTTP